MTVKSAEVKDWLHMVAKMYVYVESAWGSFAWCQPKKSFLGIVCTTSIQNDVSKCYQPWIIMSHILSVVFNFKRQMKECIK